MISSSSSAQSPEGSQGLLSAFEHPAPPFLYPVPESEPRSRSELQEQFRLERWLARRLRSASAEQRRKLYPRVYDELFQNLKTLRQGASAEESVPQPAPDDAALGLQEALLEPWLNPSVRFLEVGAGDGALGRRLAPQVREAIVLDASIERLESKDPSSDPPNLRRVVAPALSGVIPPRSVDLIFSCHFIEHLHPEDAEEHFREALDTLVPGGRYVIVTPNALWGPHDISRYFSSEPLGLHLREYTHRALGGVLRSCGFTDVQPIGVKSSSTLKLHPLPRFLVFPTERVLDRLPLSWRRYAIQLLANKYREPLRPLEQVLLVATRPQ
ncbi:MAG: class I SAM-dependent methyltransferase [Acidobacteriota bacterium]